MSGQLPAPAPAARRLRRRALGNLGAVLLLLAGLGMVDVDSAPSPVGPAEAEEVVVPVEAVEEDGDDANVVRTPAPDGEAAVALVLDRREMSVDQTVSFHLANRGEVPLTAELGFAVDQLQDGDWKRLRTPDSGGNVSTVPTLGVLLPPDGASEPEVWPAGPWEPPEPGRYRILKTVRHENADEDIELTAYAAFDVTE